MPRVAVVGSGIAGLAAAHGLAAHAAVTLFEAESWFGGHAHTVDIWLEGHRHGVDTGFLVYNERTYPLLVALFDELGVDSAASDMSFSVQAPSLGWEWCGSSLAGVFAQRGNLVSPRFWGLLAEVLRFNRLATALARSVDGKSPLQQDLLLDQPLGDFLDAHRFGTVFRDAYLLPMIGCIWSCPTEQMLRFPLATLIRFCDNHGLLQLRDRPQWRTVRGGSRHYVDKLVASIADARRSTPVQSVRRLPPGSGAAGVEIRSARGLEHFDEVVLACHSDQALRLLVDARDDERDDERDVLGAIAYRDNRAVLHTDASALPRRRAAWAAWNYERAAGDRQEREGVCLHYLLNRLQPLPWRQPVIVSLNPLRPIREKTVLGEWAYAHPVFDRAAIRAQRRLPALQGHSHLWFCGAWTGYGFHEDGLRSARLVVEGLRSKWAAQRSQGRAA